MPRIAPRYSDKLLGIIESLDDERLSLAEVTRRVGDAAERTGIIRPSPVHVRAVIADLRERRRDEREIRAAGIAAAGRMASGRSLSPWEIQRALLEAEERVGERARRRRR